MGIKFFVSHNWGFYSVPTILASPSTPAHMTITTTRGSTVSMQTVRTANSYITNTIIMQSLEICLSYLLHNEVQPTDQVDTSTYQARSRLHH